MSEDCPGCLQCSICMFREFQASLDAVAKHQGTASAKRVKYSDCAGSVAPPQMPSALRPFVSPRCRAASVGDSQQWSVCACTVTVFEVGFSRHSVCMTCGLDRPCKSENKSAHGGGSWRTGNPLESMSSLVLSLTMFILARCFTVLSHHNIIAWGCSRWPLLTNAPTHATSPPDTCSILAGNFCEEELSIFIGSHTYQKTLKPRLHSPKTNQ